MTDWDISGATQRQVTHSVGDTGKGEANGEAHDLVLELEEELVGLVLGVAVGGNKVLEETAARLLLSEEGNLDTAVEELGNLLEVGLDHGTRGEGRGTDTDTAGGDGRSSAGDSVLVEGDVAVVKDSLELGASEAKRTDICC